LLVGFEPPAVDLRARLDKLRALLDEMKVIAHPTREYTSYIAQVARILLKGVGTETPDCPRLFTLLPEELGMIDRLILGQTGMRLTLWCEYPDEAHPVCVIGSGGKSPGGEQVGGEWVIKRPREWLVKIAPYAKVAATLLAAAVPIGGHVWKVVIDEALRKGVEGKIELMETLTEKLLTATKELGELGGSDVVRSEPDDRYGNQLIAEGAGLRQLHQLLLELEPSHKWGGLRRVLSNTGDYLWLCPAHYSVYDPGLPVLPEPVREVDG
jgi:hypothetical protein